jgi:protein-arginine kinase activator protein McsA
MEKSKKNDNLPLEMVQRCRVKSDKRYGAVHISNDQCFSTVCGLEIDSKWWVDKRMTPTCKNCMKKIPEIYGKIKFTNSELNQFILTNLYEDIDSEHNSDINKNKKHPCTNEKDAFEALEKIKKQGWPVITYFDVYDEITVRLAKDLSGVNVVEAVGMKKSRVISEAIYKALLFDKK